MEGHVKDNGLGDGGEISDAKSNHGNHLTDFQSAWKQFDNVGSKLLVQLCGSLVGGQYDTVTKEMVALLGPIFACGESELVLGRLKEIESLLTGHQQQQSEAGDIPIDEQQTTLKCLLLYIKLQAEYHQLCSNLVSSAIDRLTITSEDQEKSELFQQIQSLKLKNLSTPVSSPVRHEVLCRKMSGAGNNSPKTHKHGLKASLFSLFERKNSPEEGKSSFYVDIDQKQSEENTNQSETVSKDHVTQNSQSDVLVDLGLDPSPQEKISDKGNTSTLVKSGMTANGQVATQEELDSVINLLSGAALGRGTMQTIPETRNPMNLQVPPLQPGAALSPSTSDSMDERTTPVRNKSQRRSEGSIDFSGFVSTGHNTWPHQHRASLPGGQSGAPPQITYDFASTPVQQQQQQQNYCTGYRPTTLPPGGAGHFQAAYGMGFPDPKLNRTWPVNNLAGSGSVMDTINSSWSGGHDSDDLSDDSSCGEQFQTMSRLQYTEPRRHTFEETDYMRDERTGEVKHHSLEDLLDGRSSNTWPQQLHQPWSQSHLGMELIGSHDQSGYHRPVGMQMSDPLSRRNIWQNSGHDFPLQPSQSQSVHGGLGPM